MGGAPGVLGLAWGGGWFPPILGLVVSFEAPWEEVLVVLGWVGLEWGC